MSSTTKFGPFNADTLLAHHRLPTGCVLVFGPRDQVEAQVKKSGWNLNEFDQHTLTAGKVGTLTHGNGSGKTCEFDVVESEPAEGTNPPGDPTPGQLCLCLDSSTTCPIGTIPDCSENPPHPNCVSLTTD